LLSLGCAGSVAVSMAVAASLGGPQVYLRADRELAALLRDMALIKAFIVMAAVGVLFWRFGHGIGRGLAVMYLVGACLLAGATTLIWDLTSIGLAALVFHVGGFMLLCAAFADHKSGIVTTPKCLARL
jgi:hypothetical protein